MNFASESLMLHSPGPADAGQVATCRRDYGGHIGYSVRPSERRKGYATEMLRQCLPHCKAPGLDRVLITCADSNEASRQVILANGGLYEKTVFEPLGQRNLKRYWITI